MIKNIDSELVKSVITCKDTCWIFILENIFRKVDLKSSGFLEPPASDVSTLPGFAEVQAKVRSNQQKGRLENLDQYIVQLDTTFLIFELDDFSRIFIRN